ncbi:MAG: hypothetical protein SGBAC_001674 [Bacillariaceae sp.]
MRIKEYAHSQPTPEQFEFLKESSGHGKKKRSEHTERTSASSAIDDKSEASDITSLCSPTSRKEEDSQSAGRRRKQATSTKKEAKQKQKTKTTTKSPKPGVHSRRRPSVTTIAGVPWALDENGHPLKRLRKKSDVPQSTTRRKSTKIREIDGQPWLVDGAGEAVKKLKRRSHGPVDPSPSDGQRRKVIKIDGELWACDHTVAARIVDKRLSSNRATGEPHRVSLSDLANGGDTGWNLPPRTSISRSSHDGVGTTNESVGERSSVDMESKIKLDFSKNKLGERNNIDMDGKVKLDVTKVEVSKRNKSLFQKLDPAKEERSSEMEILASELEQTKRDIQAIKEQAKKEKSKFDEETKRLQMELQESNHEVSQLQHKFSDLTSKMEEGEENLEFAYTEVNVLRNAIEMMNLVDEKQIEQKYERERLANDIRVKSYQDMILTLETMNKDLNEQLLLSNGGQKS